jgi:release factor glutamine methyltransferase
MLADHVAEQRLAAGARVLDLCAGSGFLGIAAALGGAAEVTGVDISRRAVTAVRLNAWVNGVRVRAVRGDLFAAVPGRRFDLILSNPPYLPGEVDTVPRRGLARAWEGGRSGRAFIDQIAARAADHLTDDGSILLVYSSVCGEAGTLDALRAGGLAPDVVVRRRGPLGPRLHARADWLRRQRLLLDGDEEEILLVRATRVRVASRTPGRVAQAA